VWDIYALASKASRCGESSATLTPEEFVANIDFRYLSDALDPDEAVEMLRALAPTRAERVAELERDGYPGVPHVGGVGCGYEEAKVRELCRAALADGVAPFKTKVGLDLAGDVRRCEVMARGDRRSPADGRRQ